MTFWQWFTLAQSLVIASEAKQSFDAHADRFLLYQSYAKIASSLRSSQ